MTATVERVTVPTTERPARVRPAAPRSLADNRTAVNYDPISGRPCLFVRDLDGTVHFHEMTRDQLDDLVDQIAALDGNDDEGTADSSDADWDRDY